VATDEQVPPTTSQGRPAYVYGVMRAASARPQSAGVSDAAVTPIGHRGLAALASRVTAQHLRAKRRDLLRHSDVLQSAFADDTVVPLRFGTVFADDTDVVDGFLEPRYEELDELLHRFDGLAELSVRAFYKEDAVLAKIVRDDPRVARLRQASAKRNSTNAAVALGEAVAAALRAQRAVDADELVGRLRALARDLSVEELQAEYEVLRAAFLVERTDIEAFDAALADFARAREGYMLFKYVGPLPPHSFVALEGRRP
jgi:hypothetical protein